MESCLKNRRKECVGELEIPTHQLSLQLLKACRTLDGFCYFGRMHIFNSCGSVGWKRSTAASWSPLQQHLALPACLRALGNAPLQKPYQQLPECQNWCFHGNAPLCGSPSLPPWWEPLKMFLHGKVTAWPGWITKPPFCSSLDENRSAPMGRQVIAVPFQGSFLSLEK